MEAATSIAIAWSLAIKRNKASEWKGIADSGTQGKRNIQQKKFVINKN